MKKAIILILIIGAALGGYLVGGLKTTEPNEEISEDTGSKVDVSLQDGDGFDFLVEPDYQSFDLEEESFMVGLGVGLNLELGERRYSGSYYFPPEIEVRVGEETTMETNYGDPITFSELRDMSEGVTGPPQAKVIGDFFVVEDEFFVEAEEIIKTVQ